MVMMDDDGCLTEVIDQWMKGLSGPPTWRELADNLNKIREKELADQLMSIYQRVRNVQCMYIHVPYKHHSHRRVSL